MCNLIIPRTGEKVNKKAAPRRWGAENVTRQRQLCRTTASCMKNRRTYHRAFTATMRVHTRPREIKRHDRTHKSDAQAAARRHNPEKNKLHFPNNRIYHANAHKSERTRNVHPRQKSASARATPHRRLMSAPAERPQRTGKANHKSPRSHRGGRTSAAFKRCSTVHGLPMAKRTVSAAKSPIAPPISA